MAAFAYMLECSDGRFYVGSHRGEDVNGRVEEHQMGLYPKAWTFRRRPVKLVWSEQFEEITDAIACERRLKGWSRAKKQALIRGDWDAVCALARSPDYRPSTAFEDRLAAAVKTETDDAAIAAPHPRPSTSSG